MFWTFLATALLAVLTVLWRLRPTKAHSIKAVTLSGMEAAMVILLAVTLDLLAQDVGLQESIMMQIFVYLFAAGGLLCVGLFLSNAWAALRLWQRERGAGHQHFDLG